MALPYPFHYGALPQTYENPQHKHPDTGAKGDNDPLDAVDLSDYPAECGNVKQVKVLGTYALLDEGRK